MRYQGKVRNWNDDKGYGFVEPNGGGQRAFVHISSFVRPGRRPVDGDVITYTPVQGKDGRYKASGISFSRPTGGVSKERRKNGMAGTIFATGFWIFLAVAVFFEKLPIEVLAVYIVASIIAFLAYALDKSAARNSRWRTKESTLHLIAVVGGWPGALYAQNRLRHKSSKSEFRFVFWITVVINVAAIAYLVTENGSEFIGSIVGM